MRATSGIGAVLAAIWLVITTAISVANLPADASDAWKAIVTASEYIPLGLAALFVGVLIWSFWPSKERPKHRMSVEAERERRRDMPFREALRHFAYCSDWGHRFQHPSAFTMNAVYWPQAVQRQFCQPLIDGEVLAFGIRREQGKDRENGLTPIPQDFWRTAQFETASILEDPDASPWARDEAQTSYTDIVFSKVEVEAAWPPSYRDSPNVIERAAKEHHLKVMAAKRESEEMMERQREAARRAMEERDAERP